MSGIGGMNEGTTTCFGAGTTPFTCAQCHIRVLEGKIRNQQAEIKELQRIVLESGDCVNRVRDLERRLTRSLAREDEWRQIAEQPD